MSETDMNRSPDSGIGDRKYKAQPVGGLVLDAGERFEGNGRQECAKPAEATLPYLD